MKRVFSQLSLSDVQKQDIKQIMQQARDEREVSSQDARNFKQELQALVRATDWNEEAVTSLLSDKQVQHTEASLARAQNKHAIWSLLTAEQQQEFDELIASRKSKAEKKASKGGKKGQKGQKGKKKKAAKRLGLDEGQKAEIAAIKAQAKESAVLLKENLKSFKQAERALVKSAEFSQDAWLSLQQQYQADLLAAAVLKSKTKHLMWNVLTAEQQAKAQKMKRHTKGKKGGKKSQKKQKNKA
jgi:protein CpxP